MFDIIEKEKHRQWTGLELIASENLTSRAVMECLGIIQYTFEDLFSSVDIYNPVLNQILVTLQDLRSPTSTPRAIPEKDTTEETNS